jgi:hypothetical protein
VAWSSSDIDGPNVICFNKAELNEVLLDITGLAYNADDRKKVLRCLMFLKRRHAHTLLQRMSVTDVAAKISSVEGCKQYESAWSSSRIDGTRLLFSSEAELDECVSEIAGIKTNAEDRKNILQELMKMKSEASLAE